MIQFNYAKHEIIVGTIHFAVGLPKKTYYQIFLEGKIKNSDTCKTVIFRTYFVL